MTTSPTRFKKDIFNVGAVHAILGVRSTAGTKPKCPRKTQRVKRLSNIRSMLACENGTCAATRQRALAQVERAERALVWVTDSPSDREAWRVGMGRRSLRGDGLLASRLRPFGA